MGAKRRKPTPGSEPPAAELPELPERWTRVFLEQGTRGLRIRGEPEERELTLAHATIGELMMRLELAEDLIEKRGLHGRVEEARAMKGRVSRATQGVWPAPAVRLGAAIHRRRLDQRGEVARSYHHAVVCRRAAVQRRGGTVHADAEGAMPLPAPLHVAIRSAKDHQRVHRALQHSMAHRTAQTSHAGGCAGRRAGGVTMVALGTRSHSDARIDDRRGGPPPLVSRKPGAVHARLPVNAARR